MKIYTDESLRNFEFWSQGYENAKELYYDELDTIEEILEDAYPDGMDATELNDLFWHDFDTVLEWLGKEYFGDEIVYSDDIKELDASDLIQEYGDGYPDTLWDKYVAYMEGIDEAEWDYDNVNDLISDGAEMSDPDYFAAALYDELKANGKLIKDDGDGWYRVVD